MFPVSMAVTMLVSCTNSIVSTFNPRLWLRTVLATCASRRELSVFLWPMTMTFCAEEGAQKVQRARSSTIRSLVIAAWSLMLLVRFFLGLGFWFLSCCSSFFFDSFLRRWTPLRPLEKMDFGSGFPWSNFVLATVEPYYGSPKNPQMFREEEIK